MLVEKLKKALSDETNLKKLDRIQNILEDIDIVLDAITPFIPEPMSEGVMLVDKLIEVLVQLIDGIDGEDEDEVSDS